jgi:hypothetical protein
VLLVAAAAPGVPGNDRGAILYGISGRFGSRKS